MTNHESRTTNHEARSTIHESRITPSGERGFAIVTSLWLVIIGVMLVTTMSSMLIGRIGAGSAADLEMRARLTAFSAVQRMLAELMADRSLAMGDTSGVMLTEVMNNPWFGPTVSINGVFVAGASDQMSLYNWGPKPINLNGWRVQGNAAGWITANPLPIALADSILLPGRAAWFVANVVVDNGINTIFLYGSDGATVDTALITTSGTTVAVRKIVCLPDGANQGGANGGGAQLNVNPRHPHHGDTYYWVTAPFQHITTAAPGATDTNGSGQWMDGYMLEKRRGATLETTYVFPPRTVFLRYGTSLVLRNDTIGWPAGWTAGETIIAVPGFPVIDHTAANSGSLSFVLRKSGTVVSNSGSLDNTNTTPRRWARTSLSDPLATMGVVAGAATPGVPDTAYTIPPIAAFISEVNDDQAGGLTTPVISKVSSGVFSATLTDREIVEIYNATPNPWNLGTNPLRLFFRANGSSMILNLPHIIPAYGFYLWSDSRAGFAIHVGVDSDVNGHPAYGTYDITPTAPNNEVGLYDNTTGVWYDTGFGAGNSQTNERRATAASSAASMQVGGADVNRGNAFRGAGTAADFVTHTSTLGTTVQWKNRFSAPETPVTNPISPNEFIEISLGPAPSAADAERRREYIEIQNMTENAVNLQTGDYWVSVGTTAGTNRRRISALHGGSPSLDSSAVGLIVAIDADTPAIAALSGITVNNVRWFGLGATSGSPTDTMIGANGLATLVDTAVSVVIGFGGTQPATRPFWFGVPFPDVDSGVLSGDTSWQKILATVHDDTTAPFTTWPATNWRQIFPTPGLGAAGSGRSGFDGAGDTWYRNNYDTFVFLYSAGGFDHYHRTRIFDEGGKINVNAVSASNDAVESGLFVQLFQTVPNPPFTTTRSFTDVRAQGLYGDLRATWRDSPFLTPLSVYNIFQAANTSGWRNIDTIFVPFMTVYGHAEPGAIMVNVNTAESVVLQAAFVQMLAASTTESGYPSLTLAAARTNARRAADRVYAFLTNHDGGSDLGLADDTGFRTLAEANVRIRDLMPTAADTAAWNASSARINRLLAVASSNYFMIHSTGFVFKRGANVMTDTPLSSSRIVAVVRRSVIANRAEILYWRERLDLNPGTMAFTFPIGTARVPRRRWDPLQ